MEIDNKLSELVSTYSVKPALNQLRDGPWFITDDKHKDYKNEKQDARAEDLGKYYKERSADNQLVTHKSLMKTVTFEMVNELVAKDKDISFFSEGDTYIFENERTYESVYVDEDLNVLQIIKSPVCNCNSKHNGCKYPLPSYVTLFDAVCSQIQEDVCVMQQNGKDMASNSLAAVHVCLPSQWKPADKIGEDFATIHGKVPGMDKMKHDKIWSACVNRGPYERFNWTLTDSPILNQHPDKKIGKDFSSDELYLRIERQVLKGFPSVQGLLFLIRTFVIDINDLEKEQRKSIIGSIEGMSSDELTYKGLIDKTKYANVIGILDK